MLVNADLEILQFRGSTQAFLEPAQGQASFNLLKMANDGLFLQLRAAVKEAKRTHTAVEKREVSVHESGETKSVRIEVIPVNVPISKESCFLILFRPETALPGAGADPMSPAEAASDPPAPRNAAGPCRRVGPIPAGIRFPPRMRAFIARAA